MRCKQGDQNPEACLEKGEAVIKCTSRLLSAVKASQAAALFNKYAACLDYNRCGLCSWAAFFHASAFLRAFSLPLLPSASPFPPADVGAFYPSEPRKNKTTALLLLTKHSNNFAKCRPEQKTFEAAAASESL